MESIHSYYSPSDLYSQIMAALVRLGVDPDKPTLDDLKPVDEFHIRGAVATSELITLSGFTRDMHIIEVGCGIGGSARRLAHDVGCRVTGIDLSDEYVETAKRLTQLLGMDERVSFCAGSALELPFVDNSFDGAWSIQMGMNVEDKVTWIREIHRVLKPGSNLVLYEVCGGANTPVYFPVPWAQDGSMSFLVPPVSFRNIVAATGFDITDWRDLTDFAREAFSQVEQPTPATELPVLGVYLLVGRDIKTKAWNLRRNLDEDRVSLIEAVAVKP